MPIVRFADPWYLTAGVLVVFLVWWEIRSWRRRPATSFSHLGLVAAVRPSLRVRLRWLPSVLRALALMALVLALARPQSGTASQEITSEGIDIVLALDVSGSMKAEDFQPNNRLHAAKEVIREFVEGRTNDRIGLIVFAAQAFTQCPLTLDYSVLVGFLDEIDFGMIEDGTAIGTGLANAINRLRDSDAESKIIILLTDGVNNRGQIEPLTAAEIARTLGIKVYTIGAGRPGTARYPVEDPIFGKRYVNLPNELDEESLQAIADLTGGRYYRAQSEQMLERIYREISALEKTEVKVKEYVQYRELFGYLSLFAAAAAVLNVVLGGTWLRTLP
ncbi:MAG TPA: VWA domain-containing protein [Acidobacteriota bacterium]|nr:VWA domain-containing protein [Acidobacteriota bacterium]